MGKKKTAVEEEEEPREESESENPKKKKSSKKTTKPAKKETEKKASPKKAPPKKEVPKDKEDKRKDFLPGQKYPTPDDEDGALAFYKSLYEKNPSSQMARKYCLEYGVLEPQEAAKLLKEVGRKK